MLGSSERDAPGHLGAPIVARANVACALELLSPVSQVGQPEAIRLSGGVDADAVIEHFEDGVISNAESDNEPVGLRMLGCVSERFAYHGQKMVGRLLRYPVIDFTGKGDLGAGAE